MTWKKKLLLPLLVASFSLLFLVFGFNQNCSATTQNIQQLSIDGFSFSRLDPNYSNAFKFSTFGPAAFENKYVYNFGNPNFTFSGGLYSSNQDGISLDFYVIVTNNYADSDRFLVSPFCPYNKMYQNNYAVASCDVEILTYEVLIDKWNSTYQSSSSAIDEIIEEAGNDVVYILHYNLVVYNDSETSVRATSLSLFGRIFTLASPVNNRINHATIYVLFNNAIDGIPINRKTAEEKMNEKDDQDRADLENQSSQTDSDANSAGSDASSSGTTLLGVFSAFVSALATIHTTNCKLPSMTIYGMQLGQMDLCTFDVPPGIVALATIGMVFIIVPLSFNLARRLVNIFRSFQG